MYDFEMNRFRCNSTLNFQHNLLILKFKKKYCSQFFIEIFCFIIFLNLLQYIFYKLSFSLIYL